MEWISVKDRLPETDGYYLCVWDEIIDIFEFAKDLYKVDKYVFFDKKGQSGFYSCDRDWGLIFEDDVTHWMPLPELPKGMAIMTCKDCVHYIICKDGSPHIKQTEDKHCRHFKNKADVVEVVRCKDCKHKKVEQPNGIIHCRRDNNEGWIFHKTTDYCSCGERNDK